MSPMLLLASMSGYGTSDVMKVLDKAILLLRWGMDISCRDCLATQYYIEVFTVDAIGMEDGMVFAHTKNQESY